MLKNGLETEGQCLFSFCTFRNHYWHDYTVQMDFFLIQLAASICPGEKFIAMLLARFEVGRGLNKKESPYLDANSSLFVPGTSKYVTTLRNSPKFDRYFPHLEVCIHESDSTSKPDLRNRALPMGEYLLMFIAQLVNDRTCIGEDKHETLRRSIIHWLAVQDMTYSQLKTK